MKTIAMLLVALCALGLAVGEAAAHTITFTWTWPTTRADGTAFALSTIGGFTIYDTTQPTPGFPGTAVACSITLPPTTANGTCTTGTISAGLHSYVAVVSDNATPPDASANSNTVSVTIPLTAPVAITNLVGTVN